MRISHVVKGKRPVAAELALLFAKAFEQTPQYWLTPHSTGLANDEKLLWLG